MDYGIEFARMIPADRVFLDVKNPRHGEFTDERSAINYLCRHEKVLPLARDITQNGLNPLELFAVRPDGEDTFVSCEGNRRLCALKLLNDPDLAPAKLRKQFVDAASDWEPITHLFAVVFKNRGEAQLWLERTHAGSAGGLGRRQWTADQKARSTEYSRNFAAQAILDVAEEDGLITTDQRRQRLSTVDRYLRNADLRDALGLDISEPKSPTTDLPEVEFRAVFGKFIQDVAERKITTRANSSQIESYAAQLRDMDGVSGQRVERRPIMPGSPAPAPAPKPDPEPKRDRKRSKISASGALIKVLQELGNYKLKNLYTSLCAISLNKHAPLLSVGAWSFLETLTAATGRKPNTDFGAYLSPSKLQQLGLGDRPQTRSIHQVVKRLADYGNSTKHDMTSAAFNGEQLANDFDTIEKTLIALAEEAKTQAGS